MKKMIALMLAVMCMLSLNTSYAATLQTINAAAYNKLIPASANLDFTVFSDFEIAYWDYCFQAEIKSGVKLPLKNTTVSVNLIVKAEDSMMILEPEWYAYACGGKQYDFYIVMNQNRYRIIAGEDNSHLLGKLGFDMLKEMAEYRGTVIIMSAYDFEEYKLTAADKRMIQKFVDCCESAGVIPYLQSETAVQVITQFN